MPTPKEAFSMVIGALGTLGQSGVVKAMNGVISGKKVAIAVIEDAHFSEDKNGNTTLTEIGVEEERVSREE